MSIKQDMPKVTIIVATFNLIKDGRKEYFRQCIESIHNQTYKNIECIVQDGNSTDGTIELLNEYKDKGWCVVYSEEDNGIDDAYDKAIQKSNGKYVFFMNSDDYYYSEVAIEKCVKIMEKENADYCYGPEKKYTKDGKFVQNWIPAPERFWWTMPWSHQAMGLKLDVLKKMNSHFDNLSYGGDSTLIQNLIINDCKGVLVPEFISYYRLGGISSKPNDLYQTFEVIHVMSSRLFGFSKRFYPEITIDQCTRIITSLHSDNKNVLPKYYRQRLIDYLVSLKLKNFDYNQTISYIQSLECYDIDSTKSHTLCGNYKEKELIDVKAPKVTIVTPTYNLIKEGRKQFFCQAVESVHNQTYKNIEHLIIDGGSTDGTLDLLKKYADRGWIKYVSEPDKGMCDAMNKGIKMAKGEYLAILNSDDYYSEDAIELSVKAILDGDADYSCACTNMIDRESQKILNVWNVNEYSFAHFYYMMPFNHETMLCKKSVYEDLDYYDWETYDTIADYDFVMKLILNDYKKVLVDSAILYFRMDGTTNYSKESQKKDSYYKHITNLFKLLFNLWSKFLPEHALEHLKALLNKTNENDYIMPRVAKHIEEDWFLYYYIKFLAEKNLKNFPWECLINSHINQNVAYPYLKKYFKLFNVLPVLKIVQKGSIKYIKLFGVVPLLKISKSINDKKYIRLMNFIPLMAIKPNDNKTKYQLFGFLPILTEKRK